jgi:hypothetical protein
MREIRLRTLWKVDKAATNSWLAIPNSFSAAVRAQHGCLPDDQFVRRGATLRRLHQLCTVRNANLWADSRLDLGLDYQKPQLPLSTTQTPSKPFVTACAITADQSRPLRM